MYFKGKKVILFSLPGAFTPTCSSKQLPGFEENAKEFKKYGIDEVYCMSVNDSFVMNAWAQDQKLENVKVIPDGNGEFTSQTGMLCSKRDKCFGDRSWRYAAIINDGVVEKLFVEPGKTDDTPEDPYGESSPENVMKYLQSLNQSNNI
jgi:peroxiredoxin